MNGQQADNTEKFTSIDDIINFYTQDLKHSDMQKTELDQEDTEDDSFNEQEHNWKIKNS